MRKVFWGRVFKDGGPHRLDLLRLASSAKLFSEKPIKVALGEVASFRVSVTSTWAGSRAASQLAGSPQVIAVDDAKRLALQRRVRSHLVVVACQLAATTRACHSDVTSFWCSMGGDPVDRAKKVDFLVPFLDRTRLLGLEIGARDAPLLRREEGRVLFADYVDTETLRKESHGGQVLSENVVPVDIVTGERRLSEVLDCRVDYIVASHVAEHVPDLLGWLMDLHSVLTDCGTVGLVIPDRRFTFDIFRQESSIAEAVEAYLLSYSRPSVRQIFDCAWQAVTVSIEDTWNANLPTEADEEFRKERLAPALALVRKVMQAGDYNDAHCWVFTPMSFLDLLEHAVHAGLFSFKIERFLSTAKGSCEFMVVLRRSTVDVPETVLATVAAAREEIRTSSGEEAYRKLIESKIVWLENELRKAQEEARELRVGLEVMRQSRLWRIMEPVRQVAGILRREAGSG